MKIFSGLLLCLISGLTPAETTELKPESFSAGYRINIDGNHAVYQLDLPSDVYRTAIYHNLADLRVFNRQQVPVPYQIRHVSTTIKESARHRLGFFPLYGSFDSHIKQIKVETNSRGAIVNIRNIKQTDKVVTAYLIDASQLAQPPAVLEIDWAVNWEANLLYRIKVESSDDLQHWQTLVGSATLAALDYAGQRLLQKEIRLPQHKAKYYRLSRLDKSHALTLRNVDALSSTSRIDMQRQWYKVSGEHQENHKVYHFQTGAWWPVDRLRLIMPENNTVANIILRSRHDEKSPWRERYRGLVFDLNMNGQTLQSSDITLPLVTDRHWQLELTGDARLGTGQIPHLNLGWLPYQLNFVAQGDGPYIMAFGSVEVNRADFAMYDLMNKLVKDQTVIQAAGLGEKIDLGGAGKLQQAPKPIAWQTWLVWVIMLLGVALMAWMAISLYRQMNGKSV
ncbi:MAG: DUF3999 domain-containing protein [Gammaproteobacteria bacterium]|nr:DUF3999 domain-containing protein [Gammaproteobacteria bacterium]MDH5650931.1 DUF3999 domain-containing protein [Gammaproteobacteria bacterium]